MSEQETSNVLLKYGGKCPKKIPRPVPLRSKSECFGEYTFNPTALVTEEDAKYLMGLNGGFSLAKKDEVDEQPRGSNFHPEKFKTEQEANTFLEDVLLGEGRVQRLGRIWKIVLPANQEGNGNGNYTRN